MPGGEGEGRRRATKFATGHAGDYDEKRNLVAEEGVSRLSAYLHFGCLSPRELEERVDDGAFRRQLCWRDFYAHVLLHFPSNAHSEHQVRYRGTIRWSRGHKRFEAWCEGRTGYPLVDAAMRQLKREGWMHNRARLVVGSFLTKDLGIDWRWGERWFMRLLLDGDEASNNGNWQWIASVGVDPQPAFRRMFNPARQQARFDPGGAIRAPLRARAPRRQPGRLPGPDRRSRCRPPGSARALPRGGACRLGVLWVGVERRAGGRATGEAAPRPSSTSWALSESGWVGP